MRGFLEANPERNARGWMTRRNFIGGAVAGGLGLALYADEVERHRIETTERTFYLRGLPAAFEGFRIVQISDIHLEEYTEDFFVEEVVRRVNALNADLLVVTGDYVSRGPMDVEISFQAAARCGAILSRLSCPERYGVLGNHDAAVGSRVVRQHMENNGLPILVNQSVRVERGGAEIVLVGLDDWAGGVPNLTEAIPERPDAPVILMVHEPDFAEHILQHRRGGLVDLVLSGHTHGGQIRLPGFRPLALPPLGRLFPEGHYRMEGMQMYVNRGVGTVGVPFRLNCLPEITVATLRAIGI
jgi:predicted MPP superfamily phosphohydrolase